jgi:tRNA(fMet)-specific endonuclease VapC
VSIRFLLDTNIISEPLRAEPDAKLLQQLHHYEHEMGIPSIDWHELRFGAERQPSSASG